MCRVGDVTKLSSLGVSASTDPVADRQNKLAGSTPIFSSAGQAGDIEPS